MRVPATFAVLIAALAAPAGAGAAARWGKPVTVSHAAGSPAAAIDTDGNAVLAWTTHDAVYAVRRSAHRGVQGRYVLRRAVHDAGDPAVQFDTDGDAAIAYRRRVALGRRVEAVAIRPNGRLTPPALLKGRIGTAPSFAGVPTGTLPAQPVLAWRSAPQRIRFAIASFGQLLGSIEDDLPGAAATRYVQGADGVMLAATAAADGVLLAVRPRLGPFRSPVALAAGPGPFAGADVAAGPDGMFAATWLESDGSTFRVRAVIFSAAGIGVPLTVSAAGERAAMPRVVITSARQVRIGYVAGGALRLATLGSGPPVTVSSPGPPVAGFELAADGRGGTTLAWRAGGAVLTSAVATTGYAGAVRQLSATGEHARNLTLAVGPRGDAVAAWSTARALRMARRPAAD